MNHYNVVQESLKYQIMIIGDTQFEDKSLLSNFLQQKSTISTKNSIPFYNVDKTICFNGKRVHLHIWDINIEKDTQAHTALIKSMISKQRGFMLVFDASKPESLSNLTRWYRFIQEKTILEDKQPPIFLIALKNDQNNDIQSIIKTKIAQWIDDNQVTSFIETSVSLRKNVDKCFKRLVQSILQINSMYDFRIPSTAILENISKNQKQSNCFS